MIDRIELNTFEAWALMTKEQKTETLIDEAQLAHFAALHDCDHRNEDPPPRLASWLASLWGCSAQTVNTLARIFETFNEDEITPNIPLSLWNAVMETGNPHYALRLATDYEFRRETFGEEFAKTDKEGTWSSARLRREFDIMKGRHYASDKVEAVVKVTTWDPATGGFGVVGFPVSGNMPEWAQVTVRERLEKETIK